jgi:hypothetical protein
MVYDESLTGLSVPLFPKPHVRKATRAEPEQMAIYRALKANPAPGGISKTIV